MEKRRYTVSTTLGTYQPSIRLTGKWLMDQGFEIGSKLEVIEGKNMLILIKVPTTIVEKETKEQQVLKLKKQIKQLQFII